VSTFGQRLRYVRKLRGLSQTDLGTMLSFAGGDPVSRFENGRHLPGFKVLVLIAEVLKVDMHWLITGNPAPNLNALFKQYTEAVKTLAPNIHEYLEKIIIEKQNNKADLTGAEK